MTSSDGRALQLVLIGLASRIGMDVAELVRRYGDSTEFRAILSEAFPELIGPYLESSALVSAQVYDELAPDLAYKATPVHDIAAERVAGSIQWALRGDDAGLPQRLVGSAGRMVMDASRQTILANLAAEYDVPVGEVVNGAMWARQARPNACSFCRMVSTRGAVYRSEDAARRVVGRSVDLTVADRRMLHSGQSTRAELVARRARYSREWSAQQVGKAVGDLKARRTRGNRKLGEKYHDHCFCVAVAVRPGRSYEPPAYMAKWDDEYAKARANAGSGDPKKILRAWDAQIRVDARTE